MRAQKRVSDMTDREYRYYKRRLRRQRECRRRVLTAAMTLCLIVICAVSYHTIKTSASSGEDLLFKYYTNITVQNGDTLWDIADEYMDYAQYEDKNAYVEEVIHINHLDENADIRSGQCITVPYYSPEFKK